MGLRVTSEHDGVGVVFTYSDVLKGEEAIRASENFYTTEILQKLHYQLADLREVNRIELTTEQIQRLAVIDRAAAQQGNGFFIASVINHDLQAGVSRFYRAYLEDANPVKTQKIEAGIFKTMPAAREWLRVKLAERGIVLTVDTRTTDTKIAGEANADLPAV